MTIPLGNLSVALPILAGGAALTAVLGVGFIYGLYSEGWDRLWVKYLGDTFPLPSLFGMNEVAFFGIMRAVGMLLSIVVTQQVEKRLHSSHAPSIARGMSWLTGSLALAIFIFAFAPRWRAWSACGARRRRSPLPVSCSRLPCRSSAAPTGYSKVTVT